MHGQFLFTLILLWLIMKVTNKMHYAD